MSERFAWLVGLVLGSLAVACATGSAGGGDDVTADAADKPSIDANANQPDAPVQNDVDAATSCPTSPCDLLQQCGCTPPLVCDLDLNNIGSNACRSVNIPGMETSSCSSLQSCAGGYVCVSGGCSRYCGVDADCGDPRRKCAVTLESGGTPIPGATTCSSACEPPNAALGNCPPGFSCHLSFTDVDMDPANGNETTFAQCGAAGTATQGQTCATNGDCVQDHLCVDSGGLQCTRMCTVSPAGGECTTGTCTGLVPAMVVGAKTYGACL